MALSRKRLLVVKKMSLSVSEESKVCQPQTTVSSPSILSFLPNFESDSSTRNFICHHQERKYHVRVIPPVFHFQKTHLFPSREERFFL